MGGMIKGAVEISAKTIEALAVAVIVREGVAGGRVGFIFRGTHPGGYDLIQGIRDKACCRDSIC
jgi:hypothetical protein